MSTRDYLPHNEGDRLTWHDNYAAKLPSHAAALGISAAQVTQVQTDAASLRTEVTTVEAAKTTLAGAVKHKQDVFTDVERRTRDMVIVLKRNSNYTGAIGADLGIIPASAPAGPPVLPPPEFQATVLPDRVRNDWVKGEADGIVFQSKRASETDYVTIGKDNISPFDDERPCLVPGVPEVRLYRARYLLGDDEVGDWSKEVRVLFVK